MLVTGRLTHNLIVQGSLSTAPSVLLSGGTVGLWAGAARIRLSQLTAHLIRASCQMLLHCESLVEQKLTTSTKLSQRGNQMKT